MFRKLTFIHLRNFSNEPTLKSHFYENVPLIVNKLQRQKYDSGLFQVDSVIYYIGTAIRANGDLRPLYLIL